MRTSTLRIIIALLAAAFLTSQPVSAESCTVCYGKVNRAYSDCLKTASTLPQKNACLTTFQTSYKSCSNSCTYPSSPETGTSAKKTGVSPTESMPPK